MVGKGEDFFHAKWAPRNEDSLQGVGAHKHQLDFAYKLMFIDVFIWSIINDQQHWKSWRWFACFSPNQNEDSSCKGWSWQHIRYIFSNQSSIDSSHGWYPGWFGVFVAKVPGVGHGYCTAGLCIPSSLGGTVAGMYSPLPWRTQRWSN